MVGRIEHIPLRQVWKHEEVDFSKWLSDNIEVLNDCIGLQLTGAKREQAVGSFSADLVCEDSSGHLVVIENQLTKSDHEHLGKLLTYMTNVEASVAIWIVSDPRPEHVRAISWLNETPSADFYLVKVEAIKIGDSEAAPLLTRIVGPSEESKAVGQTKEELRERHLLRRDFWEQLLGYARTLTDLHSSRSTTTDSYISTGSGKGGLHFNYGITEHSCKVELYIDRGQGSEEKNKFILEALAQHRDSIEKDFGDPLVWEVVEGRRSTRVFKQLSGGYRDNKDRWPDIISNMVDAMVRLERALRTHVKKLSI